ncbi:hypothetical protein ENUP19_0311G0017 [Entamoeba nuttalli]|uniref:Helicase, putative n=2 Tax=Entamoeba nuttalli TaxID=412467 RepID=K2GXE4_ENTNP|nr:helicase, putative [Entamoeba nuttalli P19]EKE38477.1 helicase, putative [Entamoeba nuttalli P19]|eukprot:XP_008859190.1 helicase, putative [Entamoeba nuttalli P19]
MSRRKQQMAKALERQRLEKIQRLQQNQSTPSSQPKIEITKPKIEPKVAIQQKKEKKEQKIIEKKEIEKQQSDAQNIQRLKVLYDSLINEFGLTPELIKKGMVGATLENSDDITVDMVIEWLCLNIPSRLLPNSLGGTLNKVKSEKQEIKQEIKKEIIKTQEIQEKQKEQEIEEEEDLDALLDRKAFKEAMDSTTKKKKKTPEEMRAEGLKRKAEIARLREEAEKRKKEEAQEEENELNFNFDGEIKEEENERWNIISAAEDTKWTGKFPSVIICDYCRRQKYDNPKYKDEKCKEGFLMSASVQLNDKSKTVLYARIPEENTAFLEKATAKNYIALRLLFEMKVQRNFINNFSPRYQEVFDNWTNNSPEEITKNSIILLVSQTPKGEKKKEKEIEEQSINRFTSEIQAKDKFSNGYYFDEMNKEINSSHYQNMLENRKQLPIYSNKDHFINLLNNNQIVVVSGTTGSGKSTQLPQFVLENELLNKRGSQTKIYVTQPRRISAVGLSSRVIDERGSNKFVGHQIRFEKTGDEKLVYCTVGVMLRKVLGNPDLEGISHLFIDEVHERDINTDFLLLLIKKLITRNKTIKIIIMSATLAVELFEQYFGSASCLRVESKIHPVQTFYLDDIISFTNYSIDSTSEYYNYKYDDFQKKLIGDQLITVDMNKVNNKSNKTVSDMINQSTVNYELIMDLLHYLITNKPIGCILIFLPGIYEITTLQKEIISTPPFNNLNKFKIHILHSSVPLQQQKEAFSIAPNGIWKIVLSTNIAETSITIPDAKYLIDTGLVRIMSYDRSTKMQRLILTKISKANAQQRTGRVGRVSSGECYKMYSQKRESSFETYPQPEIKRLPLESLCLQILLFGEKNPVQFLADALDAPSQTQIEKSLLQLVTIKAAKRISHLDISGAVKEFEYSATPLGSALAALPVEVSIGKMLLLGCAFGIAQEATLLAACMSVQPLINGENGSNIKRRYCSDASDHIATMKIVEHYIESERKGNGTQFCKNNNINIILIKEILDTRKQFIELLKNYNYPIQSIQSSYKKELLLFILTYVFYPNIIIPQQIIGKTSIEYEYYTKKHQVFMGISSINSMPRIDFKDNVFIYTNMVKSNKIMVWECSLIKKVFIALIATSIAVNYKQKTITLDGWITINSTPLFIARLIQMRKELKEALDDVINQKTQLTKEFMSHLIETKLN